MAQCNVNIYWSLSFCLKKKLSNLFLVVLIKRFLALDATLGPASLIINQALRTTSSVSCALIIVLFQCSVSVVLRSVIIIVNQALLFPVCNYCEQ